MTLLRTVVFCMVFMVGCQPVELAQQDTHTQVAEKSLIQEADELLIRIFSLESRPGISLRWIMKLGPHTLELQEKLEMSGDGPLIHEQGFCKLAEALVQAAERVADRSGNKDGKLSEKEWNNFVKKNEDSANFQGLLELRDGCRDRSAME